MTARTKQQEKKGLDDDQSGKGQKAVKETDGQTKTGREKRDLGLGK